MTLCATLTGCGDDVPAATNTPPHEATGAQSTDSGPSATGGTGTAGRATADDTGAESTGTPADPRLAITADWLAGTLSLLDLEALAAGATTREAILVDTIDLSMFAPGPLQVEITPDGSTAVVSVSPGFFDGLVGGLIGVGPVAAEGRLLLVDIASRTVTADLSPAHVPMGIAIAPDGVLAYTANYGTADAAGSTMTIVDLAAQAIVADVEVGGRPEQVSLSRDGTLGIINLASDGTIRTFQTADPAGTLSTPLATADDPSDVDFIEGTPYAIVANSLGPPNYAVIDVSDPSHPTLQEDAPAPGGVPYGATPIPGTADAIVTLSDFDTVIFTRVAAARTPSSVVWQVTQPMTNGFPLGIAVDPTLQIALSGAPGDNQLLVVGLDGTGLRAIPWLAEKSPTYVAIQP